MTTDVTRMTARVAPYLSAINEARAAGLTWGDVAARLGAPGQAARVRWAVLHCRYTADQMPLPEPLAAQPQASVKTQESARVPPPPRALPGQQKKTDAQALADLAAAGVTVVD